MKILFFGHKRVPSREGGVEVVVEELASRIANQNHQVTIYNRYKRGFKKQKNYKNCKIKTVFTINSKKLDAIIYSFFATLRALFSRNEIIHIHAEGPCGFLWMTRFSRKKIIVTIHGLDWQRDKWGGFATKYLRYCERQAVKYADEIIVLSQNVKNYFLETYNRKTIFIPNGVSIPTIIPAKEITVKYQLKANSYILFLARIVNEKGLHYLIKAYNRLDTQFPLVIAGNAAHANKYYQEILDLAANNPKIIFTGFVEGNILEELYSNALVYCLPSDIEGMPLSLLEAISYDNTCLVSDIEENKALIRETDFIFKKSDVDDLTNKLQYCLENIKKSERVPNSPIMWDDVVQSTLRLYGEEC